MPYESPINTRYKAPISAELWSRDNKIKIMRQLWIDLAVFQKDLGVENINNEGINQMKDNVENIDYEIIYQHELQFKHDIMANIHAFSDICPKAKSFIHLGVTSNFINDNVDSIIIKKCLKHFTVLLNNLFNTIKNKSLEYSHIPTLAYTHLQAAQLITVGKRFTIWNSDLKLDIDDLNRNINNLIFRGVKGTVGSEDSILKIFDNNKNKCKLLNDYFLSKYDFKSLPIATQTYSRKYDVYIFQILSSICQTIYKMMNDIRLLASKYEILENFTENQVGSSAMPYKRNPINCEKICSLCRHVINQENNMKQTYINQWLERTLDDSAIKRIIYPDAFMLVEYILTETNNIIKDIVVNIEKIEYNVLEHMPFIISEEIIIQGVKLGYDRQDIHERLRIILLKYKYVNYKQTNICNIFDEDDKLKEIINNSSISNNPLDYIGNCIIQIDKFYDI